ncbi:hypothetical protein TNCV_2911721 [Trichonephila clavipes]|nr:hypothetical protein TNCV_2911721 [Trichonephila clavipes]
MERCAESKPPPITSNREDSSTTLQQHRLSTSKTIDPATLDAASKTSVFNAVINNEPGCTKGENVIFSDESRFSLQHQDSRIHVFHRGERPLVASLVIVILAHHLA